MLQGHLTKVFGNAGFCATTSHAPCKSRISRPAQAGNHGGRYLLGRLIREVQIAQALCSAPASLAVLGDSLLSCRFAAARSQKGSSDLDPKALLDLLLSGKSTAAHSYRLCAAFNLHELISHCGLQMS